tara:strand:+ start:1011 stop:1376 length:366 start_codon:yes stop_codon:yes gene_type:complete
MASLPTDSAGNTFSPDYGLVQTNESKTRVVAFGDGFEQRLTFGINQNPKKFKMTFKNISETDCDILTNFFDARAVDGASFTYQIPTETSAMSFVVDGSYSKTTPSANLATLQVTFRQVFEP